MDKKNRAITKPKEKGKNQAMEKLNITIKEIVELTQIRALKDIVKDIPVGEKVLRETLKAVGCVAPPVGKRGWTYEPDNIEVEKDLGEFVKPTKPRKAKRNNTNKANSTNASIDSNTNNNASIENNNDNVVIESKDNVNNDSTNINTIIKGDNMVMEIKDLIKGKGKDDNARVYKGIYFDKDIANFLDNVQHGNKSEIVNKILRQYLVDNELM